MQTKTLKQYDFLDEALRKCISESINSESFPDQPKNANNAQAYKTKDHFDKNNYRPISILPLLSKVYQRVIFKQLFVHANKFLSQILCGFRKVYSTQLVLFKLVRS